MKNDVARSNAKKITVVIIVIATICLAGWYATATLSPERIDEKKRILAVNKLLGAAGIQKLNNWTSGVRCGPVDEILGYELEQNNLIITKDQAAQLKKAASSSYLFVDTFGAGFTIKGYGWDVRVIHNSDGSKTVLDATIPTTKKLSEYPDSGSICS